MRSTVDRFGVKPLCTIRLWSCKRLFTLADMREKWKPCPGPDSSDSSVVMTVMSAAFPFVKWEYYTLSPVLWNVALLPSWPADGSQRDTIWSGCLEHLCCDIAQAWCFPSLSRCIARWMNEWCELPYSASINICVGRYDTSSHSRLQFLRAVNHSVGAHSTPPGVQRHPIRK